MLAFGVLIASAVNPGDVIYLQGPLGTGKTSLSRGLLSGLGYSGFVKSPSYTLIEHYQLPQVDLIHLDLYRIDDPSAIVNLGLSYYLKNNSILLIEWPEKAINFLPSPSWCCKISIKGVGRELVFETKSFAFQQFLLNIPK